jgi:hypothetical protein
VPKRDRRTFGVAKQVIQERDAAVPVLHSHLKAKNRYGRKESMNRSNQNQMFRNRAQREGLRPAQEVAIEENDDRTSSLSEGIRELSSRNVDSGTKLYLVFSFVVYSRGFVQHDDVVHVDIAYAPSRPSSGDASRSPSHPCLPKTRACRVHPAESLAKCPANTCGRVLRPVLN